MIVVTFTTKLTGYIKNLKPLLPWTANKKLPKYSLKITFVIAKLSPLLQEDLRADELYLLSRRNQL